jgi:hypothetical protein
VASEAAHHGFAGLLRQIDRDGAVVGLRMAIGIVAALFLALVLRLEYPSWAVFTVLMLLLAQYVGAVQQKAVLRLAGTIAGGVLGYVATGALQQSPFLYLPLTFVVVAFSVAMFGQSRAPYAFFLVGLTYVVVVSNSQVDPSQAWVYAMLRIEEVGLGVVVSLVVQSTVFPTYANEVFKRVFGSALAELAQATPAGVGHFASPHTGLRESLRDFPAKASEMRTLLKFGGMESGDFRREIGKHAHRINHVSRAAGLLRSLSRLDPAAEPYRGELWEPVREAGELLSGGWGMLERGEDFSAGWKTRMEALLEEIDRRVVALRADGAAAALEPRDWVSVSAHLLTLRELHGTLLALDVLQRVPAEKAGRAESLELAPPWPGPEWIGRGIRSGVAVVVALVLENWLRMPGGSLILLCAYTFTVLNAQSPDETGDRSAMRYTVLFTVVIGGACLALLAGTPMLASYAVLNIFMAVWAFLFGYWLRQSGGITVPLTASFMLLVTIVGLNAQKPVAFPAIVGVFTGMIGGFVISALAQRLFWPVLPQKNLQTGMVDYLRTLAGAIAAGLDGLPLSKRTAHALFPSKAMKFVGVMEGPCCPPDEAARLREVVFTIRDLGGELALCAGRLHALLPREACKSGAATLEDSKAVLRDGLEELAEAFREARPPREMGPRIDRAIEVCDGWFGDLREYVVGRNVPPEVSLLILGLGARFRISLVLLRQAFDQARGLRLREYLGDVSL